MKKKCKWRLQTIFWHSLLATNVLVSPLLFWRAPLQIGQSSVPFDTINRPFKEMTVDVCSTFRWRKNIRNLVESPSTTQSQKNLQKPRCFHDVCPSLAKFPRRLGATRRTPRKKFLSMSHLRTQKLGWGLLDIWEMREIPRCCNSFLVRLGILRHPPVWSIPTCVIDWIMLSLSVSLISFWVHHKDKDASCSTYFYIISFKFQLSNWQWL